MMAGFVWGSSNWKKHVPCSVSALRRVKVSCWTNTKETFYKQPTVSFPQVKRKPGEKSLDPHIILEYRITSDS